MNEIHLRGMVEQSGIEVCTGTKLLSVGEHCVTVEDANGERTITCDNLLMALGYQATAEQAKQYEGICHVLTIGDSVQARNIMSAVEEAYEAVNQISRM